MSIIRKEKKVVKDTKESWKTTSGLPDDFDFHITDSSWGFREEYQNGEVPLLIWMGESPDAEIDQPIIWPAGKGWEVRSDGARVEHPKRTKFVSASIYGRLIDRVVNELGVNMSSRGDAREAGVWKGLSFHMKREKLSFGTGIMEDKGGVTEHLMPVAFLGEKGGVKLAGVKGEGEASSSPGDKVLRAKLTKLAKSLSLAEFQSKALDLELSDDLMAQVLDDSPEGFYAKAHA